MSVTEKQIILCDACGRVLPNSHHDKNCKVEILYECNNCTKKFKTYKYLLQHKATHEMPSFQCNFCDKWLKTKRNLYRHFQVVHNDCKSSHICEVCHKRFYRSSDLLRHLKIHSEKLFHCPKCNKQFHFKYNCKRHLRSCTKINMDF